MRPCGPVEKVKGQSPRLTVDGASSSSHEGASEELKEGRGKGKGGKRRGGRGERGWGWQSKLPCGGPAA